MPGTAAPSRPAPGVLRWVPGVLALVGVAGTATAIAMGTWFDGPAVDPADATVGLLYPPVAALVLRRQRGNRVGWLLMTTAVIGPYLLAAQYAIGSALGDGVPNPLAAAAVWLTCWGFVVYYVIVALVPLHFPTGELPSPRWRPVARALLALVLVATLGAMFRSSSDFSEDLANPLSVTDSFVPESLLRIGSIGVFLLGAPVSVAALVVRMRRSRGTERTQLQWLVLGTSALVVLALTSFVVPGPSAVTNGLFAGAFAAVPVSIAIAMLRHGLFDVGLVVSRAVVFTVLSTLLVIAYAVVVAVAGELSAGERRVAVAAVALAALAAAAGWQRAQRAVERLLYGERRDPLAFATRVGTTLDLAAGPAEALQSLAEEVRRALRLPRVEIVPADARLPGVAAVGTGRDDGGATALPLTSLGTDVGELRVTHRYPGERWRRTERHAFADVARRAATLVWAAGLVADLQASRERIVAGREEERRRLRHDLHDGVGPELAGMALQLERLAGKLSGDEQLAALAGRLRDQMRRTVAAVRRAVDDLRPPALDELGLVGALREHVAAYRMPVPAGGAGGPDAPERVTLTAGALSGLRRGRGGRLPDRRRGRGQRGPARRRLGLPGHPHRRRRRPRRGGRRRRSRRPGRRGARRRLHQHARAGRRARRPARGRHRSRGWHHRPRPAPPGGTLNTGPIRVVVVDDHPVYRDGVADALGDEPDIAVVGTAADGEAAVAAVDAHRPDVVLMDLRMPGTGGLPATARIAATQQGTSVVVLTMSDDDDSVFAALRAGARGYLLKESEGADIARAVRAAARAEAVFGPRIADRVLAFFASARARSGAVPFPQLTDREREVLDLVAHGLSNGAIAQRLFLSEKTVRNRVSDVLTKLHAASRAEAVALARDAGLGPAPGA